MLPLALLVTQDCDCASAVIRDDNRIFAAAVKPADGDATPASRNTTAENAEGTIHRGPNEEEHGVKTARFTSLLAPASFLTIAL